MLSSVASEGSVSKSSPITQPGWKSSPSPRSSIGTTSTWLSHTVTISTSAVAVVSSHVASSNRLNNSRRDSSVDIISAVTGPRSGKARRAMLCVRYCSNSPSSPDVRSACGDAVLVKSARRNLRSWTRAIRHPTPKSSAWRLLSSCRTMADPRPSDAVSASCKASRSSPNLPPTSPNMPSDNRRSVSPHSSLTLLTITDSASTYTTSIGIGGSAAACASWSTRATGVAKHTHSTRTPRNSSPLTSAGAHEARLNSGARA
mmetsp:Transcript_62532/g.148211  ORF Transcript_62532/g.148211 Transcript_62532/m.148211 type:complete len:259 (-) Transcript_62532:371-1147(-)